MVENSCVYRAVAAVCLKQFGIAVSSDVFDRYNTGEGVPLVKLTTVINEAINPDGLEIEGVYCRGLEGDFEGKHLVREPAEPVPFPVVAITPDKDHAVALLSEDECVPVVMALRLRKVTTPAP